MFRIRRLAVALAVLLAFVSVSAQAVGMGPIKVHSALNQPLDAEIQLYNTAGLASKDVQASLASDEDFARSGFERSDALRGLTFNVTIDPDGKGAIHLQSTQPMHESTLGFVVLLVWPSGRSLHPYNVELGAPTP